MLEFRRGYGCRSSFHHDEPARVVCESRCVGKRCFGSEGKGECRNDGIAGASYVNRLLRADGTNVKRCGVVLY